MLKEWTTDARSHSEYEPALPQIRDKSYDAKGVIGIWDEALKEFCFYPEPVRFGRYYTYRGRTRVYSKQFDDPSAGRIILDDEFWANIRYVPELDDFAVCRKTVMRVPHMRGGSGYATRLAAGRKKHASALRYLRYNNRLHRRVYRPYRTHIQAKDGGVYFIHPDKKDPDVVEIVHAHDTEADYVYELR